MPGNGRAVSPWSRARPTRSTTPSESASTRPRFTLSQPGPPTTGALVIGISLARPAAAPHTRVLAESTWDHFDVGSLWFVDLVPTRVGLAPVVPPLGRLPTVPGKLFAEPRFAQEPDDGIRHVVRRVGQ